MKNLLPFFFLLLGIMVHWYANAQFVPIEGQKYYIVQKTSGMVVGQNPSDSRAVLQEARINSETQQVEFIESPVPGQYFIKNKNKTGYFYLFDGWKMGFTADTATSSANFRFIITQAGNDSIHLQAATKNTNQFVGTDAITANSGIFPDKAFTIRAVWMIKTPDQIQYVTKIAYSDNNKIEIEKGYKPFPLGLTGANIIGTTRFKTSAGFSVSPAEITADQLNGNTPVNINIEASSAETGTEGQLFISIASESDTLAYDTLNIKAVAPYKRYQIVQNASGLAIGSNPGDLAIPRLVNQSVYDNYQLYFLRPVDPATNDSTFYIVRDADYSYFNKASANGYDTKVGLLEQGKWKVVKEANGFYSLKNLANNKYCASDGLTSGSRLYADKALTNNTKAEWSLVEPNYLPEENQVYYLVQKASGLPLGERATDSRTLLMDANIFDVAQQLTVVKSKVDGQYFIKNALTGYLYFFETWKMGFKADTAISSNDFRFSFTNTPDGYVVLHPTAKAANEAVGTDNITAGSGVYPNKTTLNDKCQWRFLKADEIAFTRELRVSSDSIEIISGETAEIQISPRNIPDTIKIIGSEGIVVSDTAFTPAFQPYTLTITAKGPKDTQGTVTLSGGGLSKVIKVSIIGPVPTEFVLTHSYPFEDGTAKDVVGNANGTLVGGTIANGAYKTTVNGEYIDLPAATIAINTFTSITVELFIATDIKNNDGNRMISYFGNTTGDFGTDYFFTSHKSRAAISCMNTTTPWSVEEGVTGTLLDAADGKKHHLVSTITNNVVSFYVDGVLAGSDSLSGNNKIANLGNSFAYLCKSGYVNDKTWLGTIHEFNIYSGVMNADTVKARYDGFKVSKSELSVLPGIRLYPNPAMEYLNVEGLTRGAVVKVISASGQHLATQNALGNRVRFDLNGFSKGIYMLRIEANGKAFQSKFLKQ